MAHHPLPAIEVGKLDTFTGSFVRTVTPGTNPKETLYTEIPNDFLGRTTADGRIRVRAETPSDLFPVNDEGFEPPHPNYLICDRTGFRVSRHEGLREEWDGAMVRKESWEPRHPQDFVRVRAEKQEGSPRPEQEDVFVENEYGTSGVQLSDLDA